MPKITYIDKKSFVGSLVETNYQGQVDESTIERIKAEIQHILGTVDNIDIWILPIKQDDVLYKRVLICWEVSRKPPRSVQERVRNAIQEKIDA